MIGVLKIDPEFKSLIPPLTPDERAGLEASIISEGCREALIVWGDVLIDGHNRYDICTKHNIPYKTQQIEFASRAEARVWIRKNQLSRRNLTDGWKIELELGNKQDLLEIGKAKLGGDHKSEKYKSSLSKNDKVDPPHNTQKIIAESLGMSTGKVAQAELVRTKAPEVWELVKAGEETVGGAYKKVSKPIIYGHDQGDEWYTPKWLFDALGLVFDVDVCAPIDTTYTNVPAKKYYNIKDDGLIQDWYGVVWCNPPYSEPDKWALRMIKHKNGLLLTHIPMNAEWCSLVWQACDGIRLFQRIDFVRPNGEIQRPGLWLQLAAFGKTAFDALQKMSIPEDIAANPRCVPSPLWRAV